MKCPDCGAENLPGEETCASCDAPLSANALPEAKAKTKDQKRILEGTLNDLRPHPALALRPEQTVAEAVRLMRQNKIGCVLITQADGKLEGIFTERDLLRKVAGVKDPDKTRLSEVMRPGVEPLGEDDTVAYAFNKMALGEYRHIPVERADGTLGVVTSRDLLGYLCK